jgi:hypothetical protein
MYIVLKRFLQNATNMYRYRRKYDESLAIKLGTCAQLSPTVLLELMAI